MMLQKDYLIAMGIDQWRLRRPIAGAKTVYHYQTYRLDKKEKLYGYLLVEDYSSCDPKNVLLTAIMRAIEVDFTLVDNHALKIQSEQWKYLIVMGEHLAKHLSLFEKENEILILPSVSELLSNVHYKSQAWKKLQQILCY